MVSQMASPIQLEEECQLAQRRLVGEHSAIGIVAALDAAASYIASSVCDCAIRHRRARSRDMQAEKEAAADVNEVTRLRGYADVDEVTASTSPPPPPSSRRSRTRNAAADCIP